MIPIAFLAKQYAQINQPKLLCFQKSKQTSKRKNLKYYSRWLVCASRINYWNTNKPVCFVLSYVLSITQQYKQKTA